jgi:hypothetical protein
MSNVAAVLAQPAGMDIAGAGLRVHLNADLRYHGGARRGQCSERGNGVVCSPRQILSQRVIYSHSGYKILVIDLNGDALAIRPVRNKRRRRFSRRGLTITR